MICQKRIPVLDCAEIAGSLEEIKGTTSFKEFAEKLGNGIRNVGFVYLVDHDVRKETVDALFSKSRDFFALPKDVKEKYRKTDAVENFFGYTPSEDEQVGELEKMKEGSAAVDLKTCFDFWGFEAHKASSFPVEIPGLKETVDDFRSSLTSLSKKLLCCFAIYLKLEDDDYFIKHHKAIEDPTIPHVTNIRTNFYFPFTPSSADSETIRLGEHCDWDTFSLLVQDEAGGLEARMADGEWVPVPSLKDSLVLNAGLMLEMWSGGHLPATAHRVKALGNIQATRYRQSVGFFLHPDGTSLCLPLVPKKPEWVCDYPYNDTETHYEYFQNRVRNTRSAQ